MSYTFNILSDNDKIVTVTKDCHKSAMTFEQALKEANEVYQVLETGIIDNDLVDHSGKSEEDYLNYECVEPKSWIEQIEEMQKENCKINLK